MPAGPNSKEIPLKQKIYNHASHPLQNRQIQRLYTEKAFIKLP